VSKFDKYSEGREDGYSDCYYLLLKRYSSLVTELEGLLAYDIIFWKINHLIGEIQTTENLINEIAVKHKCILASTQIGIEKYHPYNYRNILLAFNFSRVRFEELINKYEEGLNIALKIKESLSV
jgi:hypothetical protein